jgi:hypothetical protein
MVPDPLESLVGGLLLFVLPGLAWSRALFPEWRLRGPPALLRAVETATLAFFLSLSFTVLVGFGLTFGPNGPFPAGWGDPLLEAILAAIAGVGVVVAWARGGFARVPPPARAPEPAPGSGSPIPYLIELERLQREARGVRRRLREGRLAGRDRAELEERLRGLDRELRDLSARREAEYAS